MNTLHDPKLYELLEKRKEFLKKNPELVSYQEKIDVILSGAGSQHNRSILLQKMMAEQIAILSAKTDEIQELTKQCKKLTDSHPLK